jgi:Galactosyltransferase
MATQAQTCGDVVQLKTRTFHTLMIRFAAIVAFFLFNLMRGLHMYHSDLSWVMSSLQSTIDSPQRLTTASSTGPTFGHVDDNPRIQGICTTPNKRRAQTTTFPIPGKHPKFLFGIPSTLSSEIETHRRQMIRETYLSFDHQIYDMSMKHHNRTKNTSSLVFRFPPKNHNRVCSLQEWTCNYSQIHEECQIIYAFFVGDNATAPPYILDESLTDFRSMLMTSNQDATTEEPGLVRLNIRENQFDGKMTTWFQFAALVGQEFPEIDYAVKADSDTLVFTPNFLENLEMRHWKLLNERKNLKTERIYGGVKYFKTFCGKNEKHHACPLPLVGDTYMSGELNFMSMDLARYIASNECPRDNITIPHEDVSLSNYVYSYTNNPLVSASRTTIDRIFVHQERVLLTFNESADWESRKAGRSVNLQKQYSKFLWGHCNPRPMKNDALYTYFKDPVKVRKIWNDFVTFYYQGEYGTNAIEARDRVQAKDTTSKILQKQVKNANTKAKQAEKSMNMSDSCAILFFGLPRSFKRYVLPSIIRNVIVPNLSYNCDYFVHYYRVDREEASRSGNAGQINADDILLLDRAVEQIYNDPIVRPTNNHSLPHVSFRSDTNETFWEARGNLIEKYRTAKRLNGNYLYFPYKEGNYVYPSTMDNIVKQWHSIDAVWDEMEKTANRLNKRYGRVAMLRSDVIFVDPLDIYQIHNGTKDIRNEYVTIPDWAGWPVNDRMVSGPYDALKVWATERFGRLDKYVRTNVIARAGYGMHPEKFLNGEIFPYIKRKLGYTLDMNKRFCFVRVRADGGIWIDDCNKGFPENHANVTFPRDLPPHDALCERRAFRRWADQLYCNFTERGSDDLLWNLREKPIVLSTK